MNDDRDTLETVFFALVLLQIMVLCGYGLWLRKWSRKWSILTLFALAGGMCLGVPVLLYLGSPNVNGIPNSLLLALSFLVGSIAGPLASIKGRFKAWVVVGSPAASAFVTLLVFFLVNRSVGKQGFPDQNVIPRIIQSFIALVLFGAIPSILGSLLFQSHCIYQNEDN